MIDYHKNEANNIHDYDISTLELARKTLAQSTLFLRLPATLEGLYYRHTFSTRYRQAAITVFLGLVLFCCYHWKDLILIPEHSTMSLSLRIATCLLLLAAFVVLSPRSRFKNVAEDIVSFFLLVPAMVMIYLGSLTASEHLMLYNTGAVNVLVYGLIVIQTRFLYSLINTLVLSIALVLTTDERVGFVDQATVLAMYDLFTIIGLSLAANYFININVRRRYLSEILMSVDHQSLQESNAKLQKLTYTDPLTSIHNRRYFFEFGTERLTTALREHSRISLIFFDVDEFKRYNDHYGHQLGDECLTKISSAINDMLDDRMLFTRYGGDEFIILLDGHSLQIAMDLSQSIVQIVRDLNIPHAKANYNDHVTTSVGLFSKIPLPEDDLDTYISRADYALYQAKKLGRNQAFVYPPSYQETKTSTPVRQSDTG